MAKLAILALVAASALFSGCLDADPFGASALDPAASPGPAAGQPTAPAEPAAPDVPPCPTGYNNYGTAVTIGDLYLKSPSGGNVVVVYRESNGCSELQTEEERPADPDTKIAELPYPIGLDDLQRLAASANA